MKKYSCLFILVLTVGLVLVLLSGCIDLIVVSDDTQLLEVDSDIYNATDEPIDITPNEVLNYIEDGSEDIYAEIYGIEDSIGGVHHYPSCAHAEFFHDITIFTGIGDSPTVVDIEVVRTWSFPLVQQEIATGECLINIFTFIQYFEISREVFQELIDSNIWWYFRYGGSALDVLYSGDRALVDEFFRWDGRAGQEAFEREERHWSGRIMELQQIVIENTTEMSRYFHDILTWSYFSNNKSMRVYWMQELIDAGEYDRVNVVEMITYFGLDRLNSLSPGFTTFEHWTNERNLNIYTHYNFDVLLSNDWDLIREYYSIANEQLHTAQRQERFDDYVSRHGAPDTSWMLPVPPLAETATVTAAGNATEVDAGETLQFTAAIAPQDAIQVVQWSVRGHAGASISANGLLTVAANVPADTVLTITATPNRSNIIGSRRVTVTEPPTPPGGNRAGGGWLNLPEPQQDAAAPRLQLIFTAGQINFLLDGETHTAVGAPFLDPATDRMMIPLRTVAEAIDANVRWDDDTRSAVIYLPDEILTIPVDIPLPDGMGSTIIVYDRAFVPLRFVMEALDANAEWYEPNLQAIISFY